MSSERGRCAPQGRSTPALFDLAGIATRPGRYGVPVLRCPVCARWRVDLVIDGRGRVQCWPCHAAERLRKEQND